ncbi:purine-nucleoside phosphorylase [Bacillus thuringiensis]|uniref:purine-nucleoside phosphorylase n=1 Tax=Bacillus thuringiensis TaxID=1428 RepID=UPI000BED1D55|nr:purine-nucleoside phosphorylase [Bacillus thuringiensis]PDY57601.1 purine-nucleoside phosphorylase [Bacillus thuringiensis]PEW73447.1 purine-nucleoside phosphorylase [Bacillus thuringiensis]PFA31042.1 purine-nucleoside phosphorylase [Bacillus thuringiensis]PFD29005.1 purine-nucleoside phosphorylase [Bacillus thuringiensis]PFV75298.1 purine-nucleoside phosphorylase [Bacillus thuringiensis]
MQKLQNIFEARDFILSQMDYRPIIGMILGSGLGTLADEIETPVTIPYSEIPHFAKSEAVGHANELIIGNLKGQTVIAMKGRFHYYEGFSLDQVTFPVRVMKALGVEKLIITNACGAINTKFKPGDLMLITDHINLVGTNPLIGPNNEELGTRFPDVSQVYNLDLCKIALKVAEEKNITLQQGVYAWWSGPAYETPAEIRMIRTLGADAVGMSTVPEALVAIHGGMKVLGISCLTNMACGILDQPLSHNEVIVVAGKTRTKFIELVKNIIKEI